VARAHFDRGNILLDRGDAKEALAAYEAASALKPDSAAIHYNIGNAHLRLGHSDDAIAACQRALELKPDFADAYVTLGVAHQGLGGLDEAVSCYREALKIKSDIAEVHYNLAISLVALGLIEEAVPCFDRSIALQPGYVEALHKRGIALQDLGRFDESVISYQLALQHNAEIAEVHNNLGSVLKELGRSDEAMASYRQAIRINPELSEAHYNLGIVLQSIGELERAAECYRRATQINNLNILAYNNLGGVLGALGQFEEALACFRKVLEVQPDSSNGHRNLGITFAAMGQLDSAIASYRKALDIEPDNADTHLCLGGALKDYGKFDAALDSVRRAIAIRPNYAMAHSNLLFMNNYMGNLPAEQTFRDAKNFGEMTSRMATPFTTWKTKPDPNRRLRIGMVSGDLCNHPVGYFLENVIKAIAAQASERIEIYVYSNRHIEDSTTQRIKDCCSKWNAVDLMSDEDLAQLIWVDDIHILMDLSGHTALNRLPVFAWKPAPVQVSWLGYFATTGVSTMDYFIADSWTLSAEQEANFTEQIWRLPETRLCFTPPDIEVAVSSLPALGNGYTTFGCFNNLSKMNDAVVALWAKILNTMPNSRLILKYKQLAEASVKQDTCERFAAHGINAERLIFETYGPRADYLIAYQRVDIALDPFPFPGGTTTVEALWMGVPVLTLAGERFLSRQGVGLMMNAGLPDWIATDPDDYVAKAVSHASDLQSLATLRTGLRRQVLASPIFNAPRFAKHFAAALRDMWTKSCEATRPQVDR
jgi:protein O-GlcNAc transferase